MAFDPQKQLHFRLHGGAEDLLVRIMTPEDRERVALALSLLSPESRYFRFWVRFRELNPRLIEEICSPDNRDHVGWAVFKPGDETAPCLAGASFWRLKDDSSAAEVSFTVADEMQGRGIGTILLAVLWEHALSLGINRFIGHVLNENVTMRAWWDALGATAIEYQRHWQMTLLLDEGLIDTGPAGTHFRARLAHVRAAMAIGHSPAQEQ